MVAALQADKEITLRGDRSGAYSYDVLLTW